MRLCKQLQTNTSSDIPHWSKNWLSSITPRPSATVLDPKSRSTLHREELSQGYKARPQPAAAAPASDSKHLMGSSPTLACPTWELGFQLLFVMISYDFLHVSKKHYKKLPVFHILTTRRYRCSSRFLASSKAKPPMAAWTVAFGVQAIAVKNFSCRKDAQIDSANCMHLCYLNLFNII